jgi:ribonucleoside-diphosphate reductase alpha chain
MSTIPLQPGTLSTSVPVRKRLPETRHSITHKFQVGQHEGYIIVGFYDDARPGEVFIKIAKHGSTISGLLDSVAVLTSLALQYGVPIETLVRKFEFTRFEPAGWTKNPQLHHVNSLVDYVFRWLGMTCSEEYRSERLRHGKSPGADGSGSVGDSRQGGP